MSHSSKFQPETGHRGGAQAAAPAPGPLALAEEALGIAQAHPDRARQLASAAMAGADPAVDAEPVVVAEWALGVSAEAKEDLAEARARLVRAAELADHSGLKGRAAQVRISLLLVLASLGDLDEALRQADLADGPLPASAAARLAGQRAIVLHRLGRHDEALLGYRRALAGFRRSGDRALEARFLCNRGILHAHRGDYRAATADLLEAERLHVQLGRELSAAEVRHNLGFVASRQGNVPEALRWFDRAEAEFRGHGVSRPARLLDRCETLLAVRLVTEARQVGAVAVAELEASGAAMDLAEARLLLAQAALLDDDPPEAAAQAASAHRAFVNQQRPGWAALARYAGLRASWAAADALPHLEEAVAVADELEAAGWVMPALDARLIAGRIALDVGRSSEATAQLRAASAARSRGPADLRARAWHAEALLRRSHGDRRGAEAALRAGLRVLARNRATLGATELRVHATAHVADLDRLGTRLALESGKARRVLAWVERVRADFAGGTRAPRAPADPEIADRLSELRHVVGQLEEAGFAGEDPGRLLRRQAALEAEIRRRTRHAVGEVTADVAGEQPAAATSDWRRRPSVSELGAALGDRALVEVVASDGRLAAVTVVDGRVRLHHLGSTAEVMATLERLRFGLARLARGGATGARRAAVSLVREASACLDRALFEAVRRRVADRPLLLVPTAALHAVPWSTLPSCRGRPTVVAPSATGWWRAATSPAPAEPGATVLVAGPGLDQAGPEVADLAGVHPGASTLDGARATTEAFLAAADGVGLLHVAAHGRFRADNPLFSSLRLADGPLTVYDLERLGRPPHRLVLSACEAGLSAARPGDELMGLAASLLALGSRTLVASVVPVRDTATRPLMVDLHRRLAAGATPAEALAQAHAAFADDDAETLSASGFVCFGTG